MPATHMIFVGVSGSPGSVHALRYAADLARHRDAILVPLLAWVPPCDDLDERKHPCLQLREIWTDDAWQRLWAALDTAFGGFPPVCATGRWCGVASQARYWSAPHARLATCWSSEPGEGARSRGWPAAG